MLPAPQPKGSESIVASHVPQPISAVVPDLPISAAIAGWGAGNSLNNVNQRTADRGQLMTPFRDHSDAIGSFSVPSSS